MSNWNRGLKSLRTAYGETLVELGHLDERVVTLEADLGKSTMSILFEQAFPQRYFQMGIAEQNMISVAAGMALVGKRPFASTFAVFASGRAYDQIRSSVAIAHLPVVVCGSSAGLSDFGDGKTHQSIDDIGIMRVLPNMTVLSPVDAVEVRLMMHALLHHPGPAYLRINRADLPVLTDDSQPYRIGQMTRLREGSNVVVFATGVMVSISLEAAELLSQEGIELRVVNVSTIKPLDVTALVDNCSGMQAVVTAEEHSKHCGLASAVMEGLSSVLGPHTGLPFCTVAIQDKFGTSAANYGELLDAYGLSVSSVVEQVRLVLQK
jgi:transketolase